MSSQASKKRKLISNAIHRKLDADTAVWMDRTFRGGAPMLPIPRNMRGSIGGRTLNVAPATALRSNVPERKSLDYPLAANSPQIQQLSSTATFDTVNTPQEGSSFYNRIARKIMMRSLHLTGQIVRNTVTQTSSVTEYIRVMVIYDRQTNGAVPAIADILLNYDSQGATKTTSLSGLNMNNAERFAILRDLRYTIPIQNDVAASTNLTQAGAAVLDYTTNKVNINEFIKLKGLETHFKASSNPGVVGDIATGGLYVVTYGNVAAGSNCYQINYTTRLRYHD